MHEYLLKLENINFHHKDGLPVLKNISLTLHQGESLGIIGPNGGGKSTLLKVIIGLLHPQSGNIYFKGVHYPSKKMLPKGTCSYVAQHTSLNSLMPLRISDLLELGQLSAKQISSETAKKKRREDILHLVGLSGKADRLVSSLSGGERQRALLAKALIQQPEILILDEPHTGLDSTGLDQIFKILDQVKRELKTSIIVVEHNLNLVIQHCDKLLCLNRTSHWHDSKSSLTKQVLESIYHCEFEHLLIHAQIGSEQDHHACENNQDHQHHQGEPA